MATSMRREAAVASRAAPSIDEAAFRAAVDQLLNRWPAIGLGLGVVRAGRRAARPRLREAVDRGAVRGARRAGPDDRDPRLHESAVAPAGLGRVPGGAP